MSPCQIVVLTALLMMTVEVMVWVDRTVVVSVDVTVEMLVNVVAVVVNVIELLF